MSSVREYEQLRERRLTRIMTTWVLTQRHICQLLVWLDTVERLDHPYLRED